MTVVPAATGLILFAHGSRDPAWREPFEALLADLQAQAPARPMALAFLELMAPALPEAIDAMAADGVQRIQVMPIFLAPGRHTRVDLPALLADASRRHPGLTLSAGASLLESAAIRTTLATQLAAAP